MSMPLSYLGKDDEPRLAIARASLIRFLEDDYLKTLVRLSFDIIYTDHIRTFVPSRPPMYLLDDQLPEDWDTDTEHESPNDLENLYGFEQIIAISEEAINIVLSSLLSPPAGSGMSTSLTQFISSVKTITTRLLTNGRAVVWITADLAQLYAIVVAYVYLSLTVCDRNKTIPRYKTQIFLGQRPAPEEVKTRLLKQRLEEQTYTAPCICSFAFETNLILVSDRLPVNEGWRRKRPKFNGDNLFDTFKYLVLDFSRK